MEELIHKKEKKLPAVQLLVNGGIQTLRTVMETVCQQMPVVIYEGTERVADALAALYYAQLFDQDDPSGPQIKDMKVARPEHEAPANLSRDEIEVGPSPPSREEPPKRWSPVGGAVSHVTEDSSGQSGGSQADGDIITADYSPEEAKEVSEEGGIPRAYKYPRVSPGISDVELWEAVLEYAKVYAVVANPFLLQAFFEIYVTLKEEIESALAKGRSMSGFITLEECWKLMVFIAKNGFLVVGPLPLPPYSSLRKLLLAVDFSVRPCWSRNLLSARPSLP